MPDSAFAEIDQLVRETDVLAAPTSEPRLGVLATNFGAIAPFGSAFSGDPQHASQSVIHWATTSPGGRSIGIQVAAGVDKPRIKLGDNRLVGLGSAGAIPLNAAPLQPLSRPSYAQFEFGSASAAGLATSNRVGATSGPLIDPARQLPHWLVETTHRLNELLSLRPGWDKYSARPIAVNHVLAALAFLAGVMRPDTPSPAVVPVSDGGLQLEWHRGGLDIEILFSGTEEDGLYCHDLISGVEWEGPPVLGFTELQLADRLTASGGAGTL